MNKLFVLTMLFIPVILFAQEVNINNSDFSGELTEITFAGENSTDLFGAMVSSAGDVNGDGFDDIIIGASFNDAGGINAGRAYIYFGGIDVDSLADVILTGESEGDIFGISVSSAGDVNGDGYDDVIVGAQENSAGGTAAGRVYIYFGGESMDNTADLIMTGTASNIFFGQGVAGAGDVNGDGYDDVLASAPFYNVSAGITYLFYGGTSMDTIPDVIMTGENPGDSFGSSISSAGDVNGDTYADVIIGAYDAFSASTGRAYIYFGGIQMDSTADVVMSGEMTPDHFGASVSSAGDVNGDGYDDVIIGSLNNDAGGKDAGRAYIFLGGTSMDSVPDVLMTGSATGDNFGIVSSAGDVNDDGIDDVIVGAIRNDGGASNSGRAYVYFGAPAMDNNADWVFTGEAEEDLFGLSVSTSGDVNGDGISDVIVGAPYNDFSGADAGKAYLYLSTPPIPVELTSFSAVYSKQGIILQWETETENNNYGFSVERKLDKGEWQSIAFIRGNGSSVLPHEYSYVDIDIFSGGTDFQYRLKQTDYNGSFEYTDIVEVEVIPHHYLLLQNYPNPFNPSSTITFDLPARSEVSLVISNILGEIITTLVDEVRDAGSYKETFNASDLPSGIYFYQLKAGSFTQTKKMILLK